MRRLSRPASLMLALACALIVSASAKSQMRTSSASSLGEFSPPSYQPAPATPSPGAGYVLPDGTIRIVGIDDLEAIILKLNSLYTASHPGTRFTYVKSNSYGSLYSLMWDSTAFAPIGLEYQSNLLYTDVVHGPSFAIRVAHASLTAGASLSPLSVVVNKDNPIDMLSMTQLTSIFTEPLRRRVYSHWNQLGLAGDFGTAAIHPCGLPWTDHYPSQDPTFGEFFFTRKLGGGQPVVNYAMLPTYAAVLANVASDPNAIGLVAANELSPAVKVVRIVGGDMAKPSLPSTSEIQAGHYPLDRYLYMYGRFVSGKPLDPFVREYMRMMLSKEGQQIIAADSHGYIPLNGLEAAEDLALLQ